jgi:hypothetical protein
VGPRVGLEGSGKKKFLVATRVKTPNRQAVEKTLSRPFVCPCMGVKFKYRVKWRTQTAVVLRT